MTGIDDVSAAWDENAEGWTAWARTPGHDEYYLHLNLPAFTALLPPAGRRTVDVGCGEGRLGRLLAERGHVVAGVDRSPRLADGARDGGGYDEVVCADAAATPWPDGAFDLAVAFMSLQDMPSLGPVVAEIARLLEPGGRLCLAIVHPFVRQGPEPDDYFAQRRVDTPVERDGLALTFASVERPLEAYTEALAAHGFVIEALREPHPSAEAIAAAPRLEKLTRWPFFLHVRALRARVHFSG